MQMDRCYDVPDHNATVQMQTVQPMYPSNPIPVAAHAVSVGKPFGQPMVAQAATIPVVVAQAQPVPVAQVTRANTQGP